MPTKYLLIAAAALLVIGAFFVFQGQSQKSTSQTPGTTSNTEQKQGKYSFANPKKSLHYETNAPLHESVLAGVPTNVVINFNFDLAKPSKVEVFMGSTDYGEEETVIDDNKRAMRRNIKANSPDGVYTVRYNACWPDGSCHDGSFEFAIDRSLSESFTDQTGKKEVTIKMSEIMFKPQNIKVSKGTKITWVNDENAGHYVNTDPHPGHNLYPEQNSKYLNKGESYSLTFDRAGAYPYHCSAHTSMTGNLLVE